MPMIHRQTTNARSVPVSYVTETLTTNSKNGDPEGGRHLKAIINVTLKVTRGNSRVTVMICETVQR